VASALEQFELPVLANAIAQRVIFAEAAAAGKTVFDLDPNGVAAKEIQALAEELLNLGMVDTQELVENLKGRAMSGKTINISKRPERLQWQKPGMNG